MKYAHGRSLVCSGQLGQMVNEDARAVRKRFHKQMLYKMEHLRSLMLVTRIFPLTYHGPVRISCVSSVVRRAGSSAGGATSSTTALNPTKQHIMRNIRKFVIKWTG